MLFLLRTHPAGIGASWYIPASEEKYQTMSEAMVNGHGPFDRDADSVLAVVPFVETISETGWIED